MSKIDEYRNNITLHLTRISSDIEHIKQKVDENHTHLLQLNGRVREAEVSISWMKGIGTTVTFILGSILTWFKLGE